VVTVVELDFEKSVGLFIDDGALCGDQIFCCQLVSPSVFDCAGNDNKSAAQSAKSLFLNLFKKVLDSLPDQA